MKTEFAKFLKVLLLITLLLTVFMARIGADVVIKKDGRRITGKIVSSTPDQVAIDVDGIVIYINRLEIEDIIRETKPLLLQETERALEVGEYEVVLAKTVDMVLKLPEYTEEARRLFFDALKQLQQKAIQANTARDFDNTIRLYTILHAQLENEIVRTSFFIEPETWNLYASDVKDNLSNAYIQRALINMEKASRDYYPAIKQDLLQALNYTASRTPRQYTAKLLLGNVLMGLEEYQAAKPYLDSVALESSSAEQREQARFLLSRLAQRLNPPTPTPPAPQPARTPGATQPVADVPQPEPAPRPRKAPKIPIWKQYYLKARDHAIVKKAETLFVELTEGEYFQYIIPPLLLIAVWIISYKLFKIKAKRGNIIAGAMLPLAKKIGPFIFLIYPFKRVKKVGPKKRCPFCGKGIDDIDSYADLNFYVCPYCKENISPVFELSDYIEHLIKNVERSLHMRGKKGGAGIDGLSVEKDAMLKLVRSVITFAVRRRASDIHIEQEVDRVKVRARIDGILFDIFTFPKTIANSVVSAIKVMANLDISERRIPQDGQFTLWIDKTDIDIRVATSPAAMGEKVSMRLLDIRTIQVDSTKLGLDGTNLEKFERAIRKPHGLILVTGPSGSGKTTSLYVALHTVNTGDKNIITIEDPVEYHIKGLNQLQVNPAANFTFATGLRSILRQDPDIIMVGEIRDRETADIAVEAALTGHLVFSTLHTIDAAGAFGRLVDLGIDPKRFVPALICIIAQRLVRINCVECKKPYKPKKTDLDILGISQEEAKEIVFMKGVGCPTCFNSGFLDRLGIFEILMPDESIKDMLETNPASSVIRELARKSGMHTLREEGILKIKQGLTTVEEVIRVTS